MGYKLLDPSKFISTDPTPSEEWKAKRAAAKAAATVKPTTSSVPSVPIKLEETKKPAFTVPLAQQVEALKSRPLWQRAVDFLAPGGQFRRDAPDVVSNTQGLAEKWRQARVAAQRNTEWADTVRALQAAGYPMGQSLPAPARAAAIQAFPEEFVARYETMQPEVTASPLPGMAGKIDTRIQQTAGNIVAPGGLEPPSTGNVAADIASSIAGSVLGFMVPGGTGNVAAGIGRKAMGTGVAQKALGKLPVKIAPAAEGILGAGVSGAGFGATEAAVSGAKPEDIIKTAATEAANWMAGAAAFTGVSYLTGAAVRGIQGRLAGKKVVPYDPAATGMGGQPPYIGKSPQDYLAEGYTEYRPGSGIFVKRDPNTGMLMDQQYVYANVEGIPVRQDIIWRAERKLGRSMTSAERAELADRIAGHEKVRATYGQEQPGAKPGPAEPTQKPGPEEPMQGPGEPMPPRGPMPPETPMSPAPAPEAPKPPLIQEVRPPDVRVQSEVKPQIRRPIVPAAVTPPGAAPAPAIQTKVSQETSVQPQTSAQQLPAATVSAGDIIRDVSGRTWKVVDASDPSLLTVENERGAIAKIGRKAVAEVVGQTKAAEEVSVEPQTETQTAPKAEQPQTKEPWQLTNAEFAQEVLEGKRDFATLGLDKTPISTFAKVLIGSRETKNNVDIAEKDFDSRVRQEHMARVTLAIAEGKPVPAKVIKDYPELQDDWNRLVGSKEKESETTKTATSAITVTENEARNGIEIHFPEKPSAETIVALRKQGFRYNGKDKLWWAKRSEKTLKFAQEIARGEGKVSREKEAETIKPTAQAPEAHTSTGNSVTVKTERGTSIKVRYALAKANDLITSHTTDLRKEERYPQELQPRERGRAASELQITEMAASLEPEFLAESPKASEGAPIIGPDMLVESGNARTIAIKRAYQQKNEAAQKYRTWLTDNASRFGLKPEEVKALSNPVLVRVRESEVDRVKFVKEANEQSVAAMSATEQAQADAKQMTGNLMTLFHPNENGDVNTRSNLHFIQQFMQEVVGSAEQARYMTREGGISQEGITRIRNAVFAKAYGDTAAIEKLAESTDNNVRNVTNAMLIAAPRFATIKEGIANGGYYDLDITSEIAAAMKKMSSLREQGLTVGEYLAQVSIFDDTPALTKDLLAIFEKNKRSTKKITALFQAYAEAIDKLGNPAQMTLFEKKIPTKQELLEAVIGEMNDSGEEQLVLFTARDQAGNGVSASQDTPQRQKGGSGEAKGTGERTGKEVTEQTLAEHAERVAPGEPDFGTFGIIASDLRINFGKKKKGAPQSRQQTSGNPYASVDETVEERWNAAHGLSPKDRNLMKMAHELLEDIKNKFTRQFEHLPPGAQFEPLRFKLNQLLKAKGIASDRILFDLENELAGLSQEDYRLFERKVILDALREEVESRGEAINPEKELWFGYTPETLEEDGRRIDEFAEKNDKVKKAVKLRNDFAQTVKREYIKAMKDIGIDLGNRLKLNKYYHHQVVEYANEMGGRGPKGTGQKIKVPVYRGFLKKRVSQNADFNTHFIQAEWEVLSQMMYDTQLAQFIKLVEDRYDVMDMCKSAAIETNDRNIMPFFRDLAEQMKQNGELKDKDVDEAAQSLYRQTLNRKQAIGFSKLGKLAAEGALPTDHGKWKWLIDEIADTYLANKELPPEEKQSLSPSAEKALYSYLSWLLREHGGEPGSGPAAMIFKGIREKKKFIEEKLGSKYVTWEDMIPEGYGIWQPREGTMFFWAYSLPEKIANDILAGQLEQMGIDPEILNRVLAKGGRFKEMVLPQEIIDTLENLKPPTQPGMLEQAFRSFMIAGKRYVLLNPKRFLSYELRNLSGDADMVYVGNPKGFKKSKEAVKDLKRLFYGDGRMSPMLREYFLRGGLGQLLSVNEMDDIQGLKLFEHLWDTPAKNNVVNKAWKGYWQRARIANDFRESILRYANFLSYVEQMQREGNDDCRPDNFGASIPEEVMALDDIYDRAIMLANQLLGAYDEISVAGQWLRRWAWPFWSYPETIFRRYHQLFVNAANDGKLSQAVGRKLAGQAVRSPLMLMRIGKFGIKAMGLWALLQTFNNLFWRDEEKDLPKDQRERPHIILGRKPDGSVMYIGRLGNISALLDWFGIDGGLPTDIKDWLNGYKSIGQIAKEMGTRTVNVVAQGIGPVVKVPVEMTTGYKLFPDATKPTRINDRYQYLAEQVGLSGEYLDVTGRPHKPYGVGIQLATVAEKGAAAYSETMDLRQQFMAKKGKSTGGGGVKEDKALALYYLRQAIRYRDADATKKYLGLYVAYGGDKKGLVASLRGVHPLNGLNEKEMKEFISWVNKDPEKARTVNRALIYYEDVVLGPSISDSMRASILKGRPKAVR